LSSFAKSVRAALGFNVVVIFLVERGSFSGAEGTTFVEGFFSLSIHNFSKDNLVGSIVMSYLYIVA
jgi:hypothetical protein